MSDHQPVGLGIAGLRQVELAVQADQEVYPGVGRLQQGDDRLRIAAASNSEQSRRADSRAFVSAEPMANRLGTPVIGLETTTTSWSSRCAMMAVRRE